jgi:hypothetical protein
MYLMKIRLTMKSKTLFIEKSAFKKVGTAPGMQKAWFLYCACSCAVKNRSRALSQWLNEPACVIASLTQPARAPRKI